MGLYYFLLAGLLRYDRTVEIKPSSFPPDISDQEESPGGDFSFFWGNSCGASFWDASS